MKRWILALVLLTPLSGQAYTISDPVQRSAPDQPLSFTYEITGLVDDGITPFKTRIKPLLPVTVTVYTRGHRVFMDVTSLDPIEYKTRLTVETNWKGERHIALLDVGSKPYSLLATQSPSIPPKASPDEAVKLLLDGTGYRVVGDETIGAAGRVPRGLRQNTSVPVYRRLELITGKSLVVDPKHKLVTFKPAENDIGI